MKNQVEAMIFYVSEEEDMSKVYVFFADGFEEIEALTVVDMLRRAEVETIMVSIMPEKTVMGTHHIPVIADGLFEDYKYSDGAMLVLPGGMPGTNNLMAHEGLREELFAYRDADKYMAAICAAPSVLGMNGLLRGKQATCYPGFEDKLLGAEVTKKRVVTDGKIITGKGMGTAIDFAAALIEALCGEDAAQKVLKGIQY